MAVLEHISNESDFILEEIKRVSSRFIITIEDEITSWSERHFPRNYRLFLKKITIGKKFTLLIAMNTIVWMTDSL